MCVHTEKYFRNFIKSNRNHIVFTMYRLIWYQTIIYIFSPDGKICNDPHERNCMQKKRKKNWYETLATRVSNCMSKFSIEMKSVAYQLDARVGGFHINSWIVVDSPLPPFQRYFYKESSLSAYVCVSRIRKPILAIASLSPPSRNRTVTMCKYCNSYYV